VNGTVHQVLSILYSISQEPNIVLLRIDGLLLLLQSTLQQHLADIAAHAFFAFVVCITAVMYVNACTHVSAACTSSIAQI